MLRIGIVGQGFIGGAITRAFSGYNPITVYDKGKGIGNLSDVVQSSSVIFVSVPTPERADGAADTSIVEEVLGEIHAFGPADQEIVVKSTCPPLFFRNAAERFNNFRLLYMPEFLTARTADLDFISSNRHIIGTKHVIGLDAEKYYSFTKEVFTNRFPGVPIKVMTWESAALVKYTCNTFFVTKVSFFNEIHELCSKFPGNVNSKEVINEVLNDGRIGRSHFQVPGPDGKLGWGGACFPKDTAAYCKFAAELGVEPVMVEAARKVNDRVR